MGLFKDDFGYQTKQAKILLKLSNLLLVIGVLWVGFYLWKSVIFNREGDKSKFKSLPAVLVFPETISDVIELVQIEELPKVSKKKGAEVHIVKQVLRIKPKGYILPTDTFS